MRSTSEVRVGMWVERTKHNYNNMKVGDKARITEIRDDRHVRLEGFNGGHSVTSLKIIPNLLDDDSNPVFGDE